MNEHVRRVRIPKTQTGISELPQKGKQPRVANMLVADYLRPIAIELGILRESEKTRFGFHVLRHNLASFLVSQNVNPTVVQKTLRHSNVATTLGLYSQTSDPERLRAQTAFFGAVSETVRQTRGNQGEAFLLKLLNY